MSIFGWIKVLWKVKTPIEQTLEEAKKMEGSKPGWKTTEFWMTLLTNVVAVVGALKGVIPDQTATIIIAAANGLYGVLRVVTKGASA